MKIQKNLITTSICLSLFFSQFANGANWLDTFASSKEKNEKIFLDLSTLKGYYFEYDYSRTKGYYVTAWIKSNYKAPQKLNNGKLYREVKTLYYFDCINKKMGNAEMLFYTSAGSVVGSQKGYVTTYSSDRWDGVIPDTVGEALLTSACDAYNTLYTPN